MEKVLAFKAQTLFGREGFPPGHFAAAQTFSPQDSLLVKRRGQLFVVATLKGPSALNAADAGRVVLDALQAEYYALLEGSPLSALEKAVAAAHRRLLDWVHGPSLGREGVDFNLAAAVLWGEVLYLAKLGAAAVYLLRGSALKEIGPTAEAQVAVASGLVMAEDVLILGSPAFRTSFPPAVLQKSLSQLDTLLKEKGLAQEDLAALIVRLEEEKRVGRGEVIRFASFSRPLLPLARRERRRRLLVGLLLLGGVLFLASIVFTLKRQQQVRFRNESQRLGNEVERRLALAADLFDLNNDQARQLLVQARREAEEIAALGDPAQGKVLQARIEELARKVNKITLAEPQLVYDFLTQSNESQPTALAADAEFLYVADPRADSLYRLSLSVSPVKVERVGAGMLAAPGTLTLEKGFLYGLEKEGVFRVRLADKSLERNILGKETPLQTSALQSYAGNLYLLSPENQALWKFIPAARGWLAAGSWLKEKIDLSSVISLAVEGDVFFLTKDGQVDRFRAGEKVDFSLSGLDKPLGSPAALFTQPNFPYLYFLDAQGKRLVITDKEGYFRKQYLLSHPLSAPKALFADAEGENLYLLDQTKVFRLDLREGL